MKPLRYASTFLAVLLFGSITTAKPTKFTRYSFDKDFIAAVYQSDSTIAKLSVKRLYRTVTVHPISCGGNDGELHIGIILGDASLPGGKMPFTDSRSGADKNWGLVTELPNSASGKGLSQLNKVKGGLSPSRATCASGARSTAMGRLPDVIKQMKFIKRRAEQLCKGP
jgi:hypothetical protein